jgi:hypothetical protein
MTTLPDIPLLIRSENSSSERRISPAWTISQLKGRLEPITGVPASCQALSLKLASQAPVAIAAQDEDATQMARWPLQAYAEIQVSLTQWLLGLSRRLPCVQLIYCDFIPHEGVPCVNFTAASAPTPVQAPHSIILCRSCQTYSPVPSDANPNRVRQH